MLTETMVYEGPVYFRFIDIDTQENMWGRVDNQEPQVMVGETCYEFVGQTEDMEHTQNWLNKLSNPRGYVTGAGFSNGEDIWNHVHFYEAKGVSIWRHPATKQTVRDKIINGLGGLV